MVDLEIAARRVVRGVEQIVVDAVAERAEERRVTRVVKGDGEAAGEARRSRDAPPRGERVRAAEHPREWNLRVVARDEVVAHVPRRHRIGPVHVERMHLFAEFRAGIHRLGKRVAEQETAGLPLVTQVQLERVVARLADRLLRGDGAEVGAEHVARAVDDRPVSPREHAILCERSACRAPRRYLIRLAHAEAQRRIARIGLLSDEDVVPPIANVARAQHEVHRQLALEREHVVVGVRRLIVVIEERVGVHRDERREVQVWIRMLRRRVDRSRAERIALDVVGAVGRRDERTVEERRRRAQVVVAVGRHRVHDARRQSLECGVEPAEADANAAFLIAEELAHEAVGRARRVRDAEARREVLPARRRERLRDARIGREDEACRRVWIHLRLLAGDDRLDVVVLLPPRRDDVPPHAVIHRQV